MQVEQKDYAVRSLSADAEKKSRELAEAQAQRSELQEALDSVSATLVEVENQRDDAQGELQELLASRHADEEEEPETKPPVPPTAEA